ncbi:MAG: WD40 repeat domain-containing protein, partial [Planctomycetes bacterium]|nr:WD40 repeat domain-containing protein [Planctomycetota bacterium]
VLFLALASSPLYAQADERPADEERPEPVFFERSPSLLKVIEEEVRTVAWSPDGELLAAGHGRWTTTGLVRLWNVPERKELAAWPAARGIASVVISPDGRWLAWCAWDAHVYIRDLKTFEQVADVWTTNSVARLAFSPDSKLLAFCTEGGTAKLLDPATGRELKTIASGMYRFQQCAFSPDGRRLACGGGSYGSGEDKAFGRITIFDVETGEAVKTIDGHNSIVLNVAYSPDGKRLISGSNDRTAIVWNLETGEQFFTISGHGSGIEGVLFTPDGKFIVTSSFDSRIRLWNAADGDSVSILNGHSGSVIDVRLSPDGTTLASGGADKVVHLWSLQMRNSTAKLQPDSTTLDPQQPILALDVSPDGKLIASTGEEGKIRIRSAANGRVERLLEGHGDAVWCVQFSPDGKRLVSAGYDRTARVWNVADGKEQLKFGSHQNWVLACAFSPDGRTVASGGYDRVVRLWNAADGKETGALEGHDGTVRAVAWLAGGKRLVSASSDRTVRIWDVEKEEQIRALNGPRGVIRALAVSPDGKWIAAGGEDKAIYLWEAATGKLAHALEGHDAMIWSLRFSPGGRNLVSGGFDHRILLWDPETGRRRDALTGHEGVVAAVDFVPDSQALVSASYDKTLKRWPVRDPQPVEPLTLLNGHESRVRDVAFTPDGRFLISAGQDQRVCVWNAADRTLVQTLAAPGGCRTVDVSPDGRVLAAGAWGKAIRLWSTADWQEIATLKHEEHDPNEIAFSPDSRRLFSAGHEGQAIVWDLEQRKPIHITPNQSIPLNSLQVSSDGKTFVTAEGDWRAPNKPARVKLWDAEGGRELAEFTDATRMIERVRFHPNGSQLYASCRDGKVYVWNLAERKLERTFSLPQSTGRMIFVPGTDLLLAAQGNEFVLWDLKTGKVRAEFVGHTSGTYALALSPDGRVFASGSDDASVGLWPVPTFARPSGPRTAAK